MLQFEAGVFWKRLQTAKARDDKKAAERIQRQYDDLLSRYPHKDEVEELQTRLSRIENAAAAKRHFDHTVS